MELTDIIRFTFERVWTTVDYALEGLTDEDIARRPNGHSNSIGWIAWHMARVEDRWFQMVLQEKPQLWESEWAGKLGMPADTQATGGRQTAEDVAAFQAPSRDAMLGYASAVRDTTRSYLQKVTSEDLDEQVEWFRGGTAPKSRFLDLVLKEHQQHAGQIAYVRGLIRGMDGIF